MLDLGFVFYAVRTDRCCLFADGFDGGLFDNRVVLEHQLYRFVCLYTGNVAPLDLDLTGIIGFENQSIPFFFYNGTGNTVAVIQ